MNSNRLLSFQFRTRLLLIVIVKMIIREGGWQAAIMAEYLLNIKEWAGGPPQVSVFCHLPVWSCGRGKNAVNIVNRGSLNIQDPGCRDPAKKASK